MKLRKAFLSLTLAASGTWTVACETTDTSVGTAATAMNGQPCSEAGATAPAKDGCNTCTCSGGSWSCTEIACATDPGGGNTGAGCTYDGKQYRVGDGFPSSDGCNTCGCLAEGTVACTLKDCLPIDGGAGGGSSGQLVPGLAGVWTGYLENFTLDDGSDDLTFAISSDGSEGKVVFGKAAAPPPPVDPNVGYPAGLGFSIDVAHGIWPGFAHTMMNVSFDGSRLKFGLARDIADTTNAGHYGCVPNWGYMASDTECSQPNPDTKENVPVDCGKLFLCSIHVCNCTQDSCSGALTTDTYFDLVIAPPKADGSAKINDVVYNIHLAKR
jgi:hypothetical protein